VIPGGDNPVVDAGAWIVAIAVLVGLVAAFPVRSRLPGSVVAILLVVAGAGMGIGGMLLQEDPPAWEVVLAVVLLAVLVPAHVRIVLGPFGPPRREA
jgi:hypothetical protein